MSERRKQRLRIRGAQGPLYFVVENVCTKNRKGVGRLDTISFNQAIYIYIFSIKPYWRSRHGDRVTVPKGPQS
jgi:hypothetical protein